ncbi:hypothetical protein LDENG_00235790 [Lucifuga dentata]|nr:hypothetical protein LDENG_00235790 [Lucifuga dentata]
MGHQLEDMDAESLQHSDKRRRSCLEVFLVMSIIFLYVAVATVTAAGVIVITELRSKLEHPRPVFEGTLAKLTGDTSSPAYKMQNFAYLEATSSELRNFSMPLTPVLYGAGMSVGGHFHFNQAQHSLQPTQEGTYFMYLDLTVTCISQCSAGVLTVRLGEKLTCKMNLPATAETPVSRKCWTVSWMDGQTPLVTQMTVSEKGLENWKLEVSKSGLGMFLVD